jgi:hypothetical protein
MPTEKDVAALHFIYTLYKTMIVFWMIVGGESGLLWCDLSALQEAVRHCEPRVHSRGTRPWLLQQNDDFTDIAEKCNSLRPTARRRSFDKQWRRRDLRSFKRFIAPLLINESVATPAQTCARRQSGKPTKVPHCPRWRKRTDQRGQSTEPGMVTVAASSLATVHSPHVSPVEQNLMTERRFTRSQHVKRRRGFKLNEGGRHHTKRHSVNDLDAKLLHLMTKSGESHIQVTLQLPWHSVHRTWMMPSTCTVVELVDIMHEMGVNRDIRGSHGGHDVPGDFCLSDATTPVRFRTTGLVGGARETTEAEKEVVPGLLHVSRGSNNGSSSSSSSSSNVGCSGNDSSSNRRHIEGLPGTEETKGEPSLAVDASGDQSVSVNELPSFDFLLPRREVCVEFAGDSQLTEPCEIPADGLCMYHCFNAVRDMKTWLDQRRNTGGVALNSERERQEAQDANLLKAEVISLMESKGERKAVDDLYAGEFSGTDVLPYICELRNLTVKYYSTVEPLAATAQYYGKGPLTLEIEHLYSQGEDGHAAPHYRVQQCWGPTQANCSDARSNSEMEESDDESHLDLPLQLSLLADAQRPGNAALLGDRDKVASALRKFVASRRAEGSLFKHEAAASGSFQIIEADVDRICETAMDDVKLGRLLAQLLGVVLSSAAEISQGAKDQMVKSFKGLLWLEQSQGSWRLGGSHWTASRQGRNIRTAKFIIMLCTLPTLLTKTLLTGLVKLLFLILSAMLTLL